MMRLITYIENVALWIGCAALLTMGLIVTGSVVGRGLFNRPVPDDLLLIGLLMVCVIILPLGYVERQKGHIAVTVIANLLPLRMQAVLTAFGNLLFGLFLGTMGFVVAKKVPSEIAQNLYYDGRLDVPTWPMKCIFAFGIAAFLLRLTVDTYKNLREAFRNAKQDV
ncbi:TRAP transporter small permease [Sulfitobacter geojensis]|uniref:TRAP transporter small permease n=1 Tax=Sulfitobacter geojensis TaxID=1342299 RepID=UPI0036D9674D